MRYPDWPARLNQYLTDCRGKKFALGRFDCARFTFGAVEAMTGVNHLPPYNTKREALDLLAEQGLEARIAEKFEQIHPAYARRGDIGMYEGACGVVIGRHTIFVGEPWQLIPTLKLESAYRA